jgi:hypothetical protein
MLKVTVEISISLAIQHPLRKMPGAELPYILCSILLMYQAIFTLPSLADDCPQSGYCDFPPCARSCFSDPSGVIHFCFFTDWECRCKNHDLFTVWTSCVQAACRSTDQQITWDLYVSQCAQHNVTADTSLRPSGFGTGGKELSMILNSEIPFSHYSVDFPTT